MGGLVWALLPMAAFAQSAAPTPAQVIEEGLRRQQEREAQQQRAQQPQADALSKPQPVRAATDLATEANCFVIDHIALEGADAQRFRWLLSHTQAYLHRCIGVQGLQQIAAALDQALIARGYATTRVALPAQNLSTGRLALLLQVGRVSAIRLVRAQGGMPVPDERWGTWKNAFPVAEGDILDVRALEQGVEQMKRLPSQSVSTRLEPGAEPGTSVVMIVREAGAFNERLHGGLTLDNSGSESLGRTQLAASLALDNPLGLNDVATLGFNSNAERPAGDHRSQSLSLGYSIPWGYDTFSVNASRNEFAQTVQGTTVQFLSSGDSESSSLRWQRTALRSASSKTAVYAELSTRRARSYLDDVELIVQQRRTTNLELGLTHRQLIGDAVIDLDLAYRRGTPWQGAQDDLPGADSGGPTLRPRLWMLNASVSVPFTGAGHELLWASMLHAQSTRDHTLSIDQIAIGGRASVRGFDGDRVLLAESGGFLRNELSISLQRSGALELSGYAAFDVGRVWGPSDVNLIGHTLAGTAIGLRGVYKSLRVEAGAATPFRKPGGFVTVFLAPYVSATCAF